MARLARLAEVIFDIVELLFIDIIVCCVIDADVMLGSKCDSRCVAAAT